MINLIIHKKNKEINSFTTEKIESLISKERMESFLEVFDVIPLDMDLEEFTEKYPEDLSDGAHFYIEEKITTDEQLKEQIKIKAKQNNLRSQREKECFEVINRGVLWYDTLTSEEKSELKAWYKDWLDVTETLKVPKKPKFLS